MTSLRPQSIAEYHVFLASPGDMDPERQEVRRFFEQYNRTTARQWGVRFVVDWENYATAGVGRSQALITEQTLEQFRDSLALVVGLVGQRFGSPTGTHASGTEEEFEWAYESHKKTSFPEIKFFFRDVREFVASSDSVKLQEAVEQWEKVQAFRERVKDQLSYQTFSDFVDFKDVLSNDLSMWLGDPRRPWGTAPETPATADKPGPLRISLTRLPSASPIFFGREKGLAALDAAWANPNTNVFSLVAWGGVGKTALANRWLLQMQEDNYRGADWVYGWSFYSQGAAEGKQASADLFIATALRDFGDPNPDEGSPWDKGERLANLIRDRRTLLVLDGMEPLQYPPGAAGQQGRLKDPGLQSLLRELARHNPGLCVVSTRLDVDDLQDFDGTTYESIDLEQLSPEAGTQLLQTLGVDGTPDELKEAVIEYEGHALALTLLGRYVATIYDGHIRQRDKIPRLTGKRSQGGHARRVMDSYAEWFDGKPELDILHIMGLFDRPVDEGALQALLAEPPIDGLTSESTDLSQEGWQHALANLRQARLLAQADPDAPGDLDAHPLVREHFGEQLQKNNPAAWKEAHSRLYDHYKTQAPELPDTLEEMAPLYAAVAHGCHAGRHQEALDRVYWARISRRDEYFSTRQLGAYGSDLAALAGFFAPPWTRPVAGLTDADQAFILNAAGFDLRAFGRLAEAAPPMLAGLEAYGARHDSLRAAMVAGNLSELHLTLGDVDRALVYAQQSVELADESSDAFSRIGNRTTLADVLHQSGRLEEAKALFREAEEMQNELQPRYLFLYSVQGYRYCDLLLGQGKCREVRDRAIQTLEWAEKSGLSLLAVALDRLSLGRAHTLEAQRDGTGDFSQAADHLEHAVDGLRRAGTQDHLPRGLVARAALHRVRSDFHSAQRDLDEAMSTAQRGGMRLHEADSHMEFARLHLAMGDIEKAGESLATAKAMIEETGYHRRDPEVKDLGSQLADG